MAKLILIIDDDRVLNQILVQHIKDMGYSTVGKLNWRDAKSWLKKNDPDLILLDNKLPDINGEELIPVLSSNYPVVMLTAFGGVRQAVASIRAGAVDYQTKPINPEELELLITRVLEKETLLYNFQHYRAKTQRKDEKLLVGHSKGLAEVEKMIGAVAPSDMTVLIQGESGVGKELVARELHDRSARAQENFVTLDCCTLQETLFESELFGHERGAFTGADRKKKGLIEIAETGTLFLDEIGEIGPAVQAKLLRVLESGQFRRVGSTKDSSANIRIITATNQNLEEMVNNHTFRGDLYFRLNAFTIIMPPLRERREDIQELAEHFIRNHSFSRRISKHLTQSAIRSLVAYDWPGNVRELKNVVERAIILSQDTPDIRAQHLSFGKLENSNASLGVQLDFDFEPSLQEIEKCYLELLLEKYSGHRTSIAATMGISERNVYRLLEKHDLKC